MNHITLLTWRISPAVLTRPQLGKVQRARPNYTCTIKSRDDITSQQNFIKGKRLSTLDVVVLGTEFTFSGESVSCTKKSFGKYIAYSPNRELRIDP